MVQGMMEMLKHGGEESTREAARSRAGKSIENPTQPTPMELLGVIATGRVREPNWELQWCNDGLRV